MKVSFLVEDILISEYTNSATEGILPLSLGGKSFELLEYFPTDYLNAALIIRELPFLFLGKQKELTYIKSVADELNKLRFIKSMMGIFICLTKKASRYYQKNLSQINPVNHIYYFDELAFLYYYRQEKKLVKFLTHPEAKMRLIALKLLKGEQTFHFLNHLCY